MKLPGRRQFLVAVIAALTQFSTFTAAQEVKPSWSIPADAKWALINGYPLTYRDEGQGAPIVFIHGVLSDYRTFGPQFASLASSYRLIAPSLRRSYPEQWNGEGSGHSIEQHSADVAALIRKLGLGKVHLVGWSRGGAVAIEIAKAHPELLRTLVMEDGVIAMPAEDAPESRKAEESLANRIKTLQENLRAGDLNKAAEVWVDTLSNAPGTWQKLPEARRQVVVANIYSALGDKSRPITTCDDLRKFDFPVLLMTAEKSSKSYTARYGEMKKCKPFADPIVISDAGHNIHGGNPDAYNKALLSFFEEAMAK
jgi:pimeloyl-ACP methyl ester carboxylesterase